MYSMYENIGQTGLGEFGELTKPYGAISGLSYVLRLSIQPIIILLDP